MHYGGIIDRAKEIYSMTRLDNGKPVEPSSTRVTSIDIMQLHKMYPDFCPTPPPTMPCANGDYFLSSRLCDGIVDCLDSTDESAKLCGPGMCSARIKILTKSGNESFVGTYDIMEDFVEQKVAYKMRRKDVILAYTAEFDSWEIKEGEKVLAFGLNFDGRCPQGADNTWQTGPKEYIEGFEMKSEYNPEPPVPSGQG